MIREFLRRNRILILAGVIIAVAAVTAVGIFFPSVINPGPTQTIKAQFYETPGVYYDNAVQILGVPVGKVTSVRAGKGYVEVTMSLPKSIKVSANAEAVILNRNPVSDRTIELYPPYPGTGPVMASGTVIPVSRTHTPLTVDQIFAGVSSLAKTLGPVGANKNGALSDVVRSLAGLLQGNGANLHDTLVGLAGALPAFTSDPTQITKLLTSLDSLTAVLADRNSSLNRVISEAATATSTLAGERDTLATAITDLQTALQQVTDFIGTNRNAIQSSLAGLSTTMKAVLGDQQALATTFNTAALGFQNVNRAIDQNAACVDGEVANSSGKCPVVYGRIDIAPNLATITGNYCRSASQEAAPIVLSNVANIDQLLGVLSLPGLSKATTINTVCTSQYGFIQGRGGSPGVPATPDLGLSRWLK
ncbi:MAG: MCE family protein [Actinomycetota bacterium]|nr:MCE family protein [Actinomycetota bacterium]